MKNATLATLVCLFAAAALAQNPQIPTLQVCNGTRGAGEAAVVLSKRIEPGKTGTFNMNINAGCNPADTGFPFGSIAMQFSLSDSSITDLRVTLIEQLTTTGKHTPTMYLNGRCIANGGTIPCHIWLTLTDNREAGTTSGTPDVVGVLVVDKTGKRLTYGTGPLRSGDISIASTDF